jgi:hypothetical protein
LQLPPGFWLNNEVYLNRTEAQFWHSLPEKLYALSEGVSIEAECLNLKLGVKQTSVRVAVMSESRR